MQLKDYYTTLELTPAATALQIRKSFRQLALLHHPDKNPDSAMAEARFKEIQEAYEVLSDPGKREEYNYKRWYSRTLKKQFSNEPLTAKAILAECMRLYEYMFAINIFSIDYDGLSYHIRQLLSDQNIGILQQATDKKIIREVTEKILQTAAALPFAYIEPIALQLIRLADEDQTLTSDIHHFTRQHRQQNLWQKYRAPVVILITAFICWIIYLVSR